MITIRFKPETFELTIKGHAGQNKKGEDIVCSAISSLFYTLGQALILSEDMLEEKPIFKDEDGDGYLACKPKKEYKGNIVRSYWTILVGVQLVADNYKNFVDFAVVGWQE
ncbi:MAG: ribosomal-processing cysteine protease Prp [Bacteroidaceae bacterium]|nr:ribosomal-processing cysteine protease Prp [Bacteroidaceae bacterium]